MEPMTYLIKSAAILAMFYLIYILFLRKETHFKAHRIFLISGVIASLVLPFIYFTQTIQIDIPEVQNSVMLNPVMESTGLEIKPVQEPFDWWGVIWTTYLAGLGVMFIRFLVQLTSLWLLISKNPVHKMNGFLYVRVSRKVAPFSFFNYIVYNPDLHTEDELQMILKHEQAHAFQWHSADILLSNALLILQWMNPFAWLYKKSVEENLEFLADNATIIAVNDKKDYQLALVKASSAQHIPALTTNFYKSFIKKRIIMLNKRTSKKYHVLKVATVLPLLAIFLWSFNVKKDFTYNVIPSEVDPESAELASSQPGSVTLETKENETTESLGEPTLTDIVPDEFESGTEINKPIVAKVNTSMYTAVAFKDIEIKITKNTTDAQLEEIKQKIKKEHKIDFSYSVERNSSNEITRIQIIYSGKDNNGNYSIHDDDGIADFVFYVDDDGSTGFYSEEVEARRAERALARTARLGERVEDRRREVHKIKEDREKMREEIIVEREAMRDEMAKQRKEMRDRMRDRRKAVIIERDGDKVIIEGDDVKIFSDEDIHTDELIRKEREAARIGRSNGKAEVIILDSGSGKVTGFGKGVEHAIRIDKDTSDDSLEKIKNKMKAKGVDFKYGKVKRNSNGEITGIKITVDNNKGSKKTIVTKGDDGDPIDEMLIELQ